jgi:hypothetical protein
MALLAPPFPERSKSWFPAEPQSSCHAFPASFGLLLLRGAAETLYRGSLLRLIRQLLVTFGFCFGQFSFFSAQIDWC